MSGLVAHQSLECLNNKEGMLNGSGDQWLVESTGEPWIQFNKYTTPTQK